MHSSGRTFLVGVDLSPVCVAPPTASCHALALVLGALALQSDTKTFEGTVVWCKGIYDCD